MYLLYFTKRLEFFVVITFACAVGYSVIKDVLECFFLFILKSQVYNWGNMTYKF